MPVFTCEIQAESAKHVFQELKNALDDVTSLARTAKGLLTEAIMVKAVDNQMKCQERNDNSGKDEAMALIKAQIEFMSDNNLGLTGDDIFGPLLRYARQALP